MVLLVFTFNAIVLLFIKAPVLERIKKEKNIVHLNVTAAVGKFGKVGYLRGNVILRVRIPPAAQK